MMTCILSLTLLLAVLGVLSSSAEMTKSCLTCICSAKKGKIIANCSNRNLTEIPSSIPSGVTNLDMSKKNISQIPPDYLSRFRFLQRLDFSVNNLTFLYVDSFAGLAALKSLVLHGNKIPLNDKAYPKGLFRQQKRLLQLDISKNVESAEGVYPDAALSDLVSLQTLYVDGVENATFGEGFAKLENLRNLSLSGKKGYCRIYNLFNHSFVNIPSLILLNISKCWIADIEVNTFWPLRGIKTLDLSENVYLGIKNMGKALYGLRYSSLRVLRINKIVTSFAFGVQLKAEQFRYFNDTNVTELYADSNRIEMLDLGVLAAFARCEIISVKDGRFTFGEYILALDQLKSLRKIFVNDQYVSHKLPLPRAEQNKYNNYVHNNGQHLPYIDRNTSDHFISSPKYKLNLIYAKYSNTDCSNNGRSFLRHIQNNTHRTADQNQYGITNVNANKQDKFVSGMRGVDKNIQTNSPDDINDVTNDPATEIDISNLQIVIPLPGNMIFVIGSNCKLNYELHGMTFNKNQVKTIDVSSNFLTKWMGPIHGIEGVEYLDISNNYCVKIAPKFLQCATGLKVLNISKNFLSSSLHNDTHGQILMNQANVEVLRIAYNIITDLTPAVFSGVSKLKILDLSWNMMESWSANISNMTSLQSLDLAKNRFEGVPRNLRQQIDIIMKNRNDSFHINLNKNNLKCDCDSLEYLEWIHTQSITLDDLFDTWCREQDESRMYLSNLEDIVLKLKQKCKTILPIVITTLTGLILFLGVAAAGLIYRYRWKLRYLYYTTRRKYQGYQRLAEDEDNFTYDAFVSYADEDREFVINNMQIVLEERFGLRLCIHYRDFMVGEPITANIINAIQSSRKTIVVLSSHFVKSSWCEYEVRMARCESIHTRRDLLCVVWYADVPDRGSITGDLLEEIMNDTYIRYPEEEQERELFWTTLKQSHEY